MTPLPEILKQSLPKDYVYIGKGGEFALQEGDPKDTFLSNYDEYPSYWEFVAWSAALKLPHLYFAVNKSHPIVARLFKDSIN